MAEKGRTIMRRLSILSSVQAPKDRSPHGGPLNGSAYPLARRPGRPKPNIDTGGEFIFLSARELREDPG